VREAATLCPSPCKLTFDLLTPKVVSESRVTSATSVPILVFLGLSVLDLGPMYATDRQTSDRQTDIRRASSLNAPGHRRRGHNNSSRYLASRYTKYITDKYNIINKHTDKVSPIHKCVCRTINDSKYTQPLVI